MSAIGILAAILTACTGIPLYTAPGRNYHVEVLSPGTESCLLAREIADELVLSIAHQRPTESGDCYYSLEGQEIWVHVEPRVWDDRLVLNVSIRQKAKWWELVDQKLSQAGEQSADRILAIVHRRYPTAKVTPFVWKGNIAGDIHPHTVQEGTAP